MATGRVLRQRRALLLAAYGLDELVEVGKIGVRLFGSEQLL
jgi:hypothetical protein